MAASESKPAGYALELYPTERRYSVAAFDAGRCNIDFSGHRPIRLAKQDTYEEDDDEEDAAALRRHEEAQAKRKSTAGGASRLARASIEVNRRLAFGRVPRKVTKGGGAGGGGA